MVPPLGEAAPWTIVKCDKIVGSVPYPQEALANVHRHAGSKSVLVKMQLEEGCIRASVADTGRGIPSKILEGINSTSSGLGGVGIAGMKERIHQIGGHLEVVSDRRGTTLTAVVPAGHNVTASRTTESQLPFH